MSTLASHLGKAYGYSCQTWLSKSIAERYFGGLHRIWFSTKPNPTGNGHSSNPIVLFRDLDVIVATNDIHHSRVSQLRERLTNWIVGSSLSSKDIVNLSAEISAAPIVAFRPQLWKIELANIHITRLINLGQFPDEYLITDVIGAEFEVIAE